MQRIVQILILLLFIGLTANSAFCKPKHLFKIGTLAPDGSVWINQFNEFNKEIQEKTNGEVGFRIYPGGVMGDDQAMLRKMRVGQLHGGGFTMTGVASLVPDFRVMSLPFLFENYKEIDYVAQGLIPHFKKEFNKKRLEFLAINEVGFVYAMSSKPMVSIADFKNSKSWIPAGDPVTESFMEALGVSPIQLTIPDVLSSLQTGLIDTVFNSLYGSIVLQWFTKATYITEDPYGYAYGAFVLDKKTLDKLPAEYATFIKEAAVKHFDILRVKTRESNDASRVTLKQHGVKFVPANEGTINEMKVKRGQALNKLLGKAFSQEVYDNAIELLENYRKQ